MLMVVPDHEKAERPAYDARQRYYDVMFDRVTRALDLLSAEQYRLAGMEFYNAYTFVRAWISTKDLEKLDGLFEKLFLVIDEMEGLRGYRDPAARHAQGSSRVQAQRQMMMVQREMMNASKHMMLPSGGDGDVDEWDEKEFRRRSGLT